MKYINRVDADLVVGWSAAALAGSSESCITDVEQNPKNNPVRRKVLIIEDEPSIRNALFVLLAGLGCEGDVAYTGQQALAMISREQFDAVLLDLRCSHVPVEQVVSQIREIRPKLVGRVLVITGEVTDPQTVGLLSRYLLPHISANRLMPELWERLRSILGLAPSPDIA